MLYQQSPTEVALKLIGLSSKDLVALIKENDQMLLTWNQTELFRKWPRCMVPGPIKAPSNNILFTSMLQTTKQKAYQYHNLIQPIDYVFQKKQHVVEEGLEKEGEFQMKQDQGDKQLGPSEIKQGEQQIIQQKQPSLKTSNARKFQQQFSPFLPNHDNPFDRNANSKTLKYKFDRLKLDNRKRNIAALVEQSKQANEQRDRFSYGRSAPKKATQSIDITDILKYTLGIKKQREQNVQPPPIKNPFVKVPPKYYDTMGDFYGGFAK